MYLCTLNTYSYTYIPIYIMYVSVFAALVGCLDLVDAKEVGSILWIFWRKVDEIDTYRPVFGLFQLLYRYYYFDFLGSTMPSESKKLPGPNRPELGFRMHFSNHRTIWCWCYSIRCVTHKYDYLFKSNYEPIIHKIRIAMKPCYVCPAPATACTSLGGVRIGDLNRRPG